MTHVEFLHPSGQGQGRVRPCCHDKEIFSSDGSQLLSWSAIVLSNSCRHEAGLVDLTSQEGLRLSSVIHGMEGQSSMGWKDKAGPWTKEARAEVQEVTSEVFCSQHFEQQTCGVFPYTNE